MDKNLNEKYDYNKLLEKCIKQIPEESYTKERFEMPILKTIIVGSKTEVSNLLEVSKIIYRDPKDIIKYLGKELASPGTIERQKIIFKGKLTGNMVNTKFKRYVTDFVLCHECKKPDTKIMKEGKQTFMKCMACGAKRPISKVG
ncbi:MAG: translation initiation factor IF-2 subunit beta [DPANN group archaeon]|nr:translation initiation factor IF-2 subunit beta [DPANN group archaeon]